MYAILKKNLHLLMCFFVLGCSPSAAPEGTASTTFTPSQNDSSHTSSGEKLSIPPELVSGGGGSTEKGQMEELKGLKGVKVEQLFSENITNEAERLKRIENVVTDIYRDLETLKSPIVRLVAIEKDMQALIAMMSEDSVVPSTPPEFPVNADAAEEVLIEPQSPAPLPSDASETSAEVMPVQSEQVPPQTADLPQIKALRVGDQADFSRIVIEFSEKIDFDVSYDGPEKSLKIIFPLISKDGFEQKRSIVSSLISGYSLEEKKDEQKNLLVFPAVHNLEILRKISYQDDNASSYKIVIDVKLDEKM